MPALNKQRPPATPSTTYFTKLAGGCFGIDQSGRTLFYRLGPLSRPYVLENAVVEAQLRAVSTSFYRRMVFGTACLFLLFPVLPIYWSTVVASFALRTRYLVANCERGIQSLTIRTSIEKRSLVYSSSLLFAAFLISFFALVCSVLMCWKLTSKPDLQLGFFLIAIATASCASLTWFMWRHRLIN